MGSGFHVRPQASAFIPADAEKSALSAPGSILIASLALPYPSFPSAQHAPTPQMKRACVWTDSTMDTATRISVGNVYLEEQGWPVHGSALCRVLCNHSFISPSISPKGEHAGFRSRWRSRSMLPCPSHDHIKITTKLQNNHHLELLEVWLNESHTTGDIHKRLPGDR